jgi:cystatin-C
MPMNSDRKGPCEVTMKTKLQTLIILIILTALAGDPFRVVAQQPQIVGGYKDTSATDPEVRLAASFAIKQERRTRGRRLSLVSIERAEVQVVAGLNYRLCLKVKSKGRTQEVTAVVYQNLKRKYSLSKWDAGGCGMTP